MSNSNNDTIKIQVALVPPNCFPIYTQTNPLVNPYPMMMMNPYMNPQMFAMQQQMAMMPNFPYMNTANYDMTNSSHMNPLGNIPNSNISAASIENINGSNATSNNVSASTNLNNKSFTPQVEFHPSVLTFNVFIDPSKTILQLADAIYAKTSRLYPNLKRPLDILKLKDFEKNDLDIEDTVNDCFLKGNVSRLTVLCCTKHPLDFNTRSNNYKESFVQGESDYSNIMNSDFNNPEYEDEDNAQFQESGLNTMTQLQLSRKRNVSLVYQNRQKVPSIIIQKKNRKQSVSKIQDKSPVDSESLLPPPVERSPQMRISSNIGETRKRIFSTNLGQAMDAVSRSEEVDPDKRKTIDMVMTQESVHEQTTDTPSKDIMSSDSSPYKNATPNRMNSGLRMISANNTVVKSQPMPNMLMNSVQRHTTISKRASETDQAKFEKTHGKLHFGGLTDPILKSPGNNSVLPPKGDRIPMKQGLRDDIDMLSSSSEDENLEDETNKQPLIAESHIINDMSAEKNNGLKDTVGQLTPLNVKTTNKKVSEESPLRNEDADNSNNTSLLKMAQLPNEKDVPVDNEDRMDVEDENRDSSVIMNSLDQEPKPLVQETGRTKRRAALAAAGKLDNRSVRVTNNEGKEVIMPYNKVNSYMKTQQAAKDKDVTPTPKSANSNNLFDSLNSNTAEPINSPMSMKTKDVDMESSSSGSSTDSSSESCSSDEDNDMVEDSNTRKVKVDVDTTSKRVPSAKQQTAVGKVVESVETQPVVATEQPEEMSTLQRMRRHKNQKSLGSLSDLIARGIPPVMDRAAEKRMMLEKQRKEEEEKKEMLMKQKEEEPSSSESSSTDSETDSDSDSDSDSSTDSDFKGKKTNFIKKTKKKGGSAFASLVKDSKKL